MDPSLGALRDGVSRRTARAASPGRGSRSGDRVPTWVRWSLAAGGVLIPAYLVVLVLVPGAVDSLTLNGWCAALAELVWGVACIARARSFRRPLSALLIGTGCVSWALGDLVETVESLGGRTPSDPSWADAFYVGFYAAALVGVVALLPRTGRRGPFAGLDALVSCLGVVSACLPFAMPGIRQLDLVHTGLGLVVNVTYPVGDLILLGLVAAAVAMSDGQQRLTLALLGLAMTVNSVGDIANVVSATAGGSDAAIIADHLAWPLSNFLVARALWLPQHRTARSAVVRTTGWLLPGCATAAAAAVVLFDRAGSVDVVPLSFAATTLLVSGVRLASAMRALRRSMDRQQIAALTDHLTGLWNRRYVDELLGLGWEELADLGASYGHGPDGANEAGHRPGACVLMIDIDRFKPINDTYGHDVGDELLCVIARRLTEAVRSTDVVARLGGDEFAVLLPATALSDAAALADHLVRRVTRPVELSVATVTVGASVGVAAVTEGESGGWAALSAADSAMYRAKLSGGSVAVFDATVDDWVAIELAAELGTAIADDDLDLTYERLRDLNDRSGPIDQVTVRWPHARLGLVPWDRLRPIAERADLLPALTEWTVRTVVAHGRRAGGDAHGRTVCVAVDGATLSSPGFVDRLAAQTADSGVRLVLEISEATLLTDPRRLRTLLAALSRAGVGVCIGDVGAGLATLAFLGDEAVRQVKIDAAVLGAARSGDESEVDRIRRTIELAHAHDVEVTADGVEDPSTVALLRRLGCDRLVDVRGRVGTELSPVAAAG